MRFFGVAALFAALWSPTQAGAHEVLQTIERNEATAVTLRYADGTPFSYESYEIYRESEEIAYQVGRTDLHGRIVFVPDRTGSWRIRAFSKDGHGADFIIEASPVASAGPPAGEDPSRFRAERIVTGIAVLFGLFGVLSLVLRRRSP